MEPLLEEDDIVVVDRADCDLKNIHENSIYAVVLYSTPFITLVGYGKDAIMEGIGDIVG